MANKVTGSTDTSGALAISPSTAKSILIMAKVTGEPEVETDPNKIFKISTTNDVKARFGEESVMVQAVRILISNGVDYINGIIVEDTSEEHDGSSYDYEAALTASLDDSTIKIILMDTNKELTALRSHLELCEDNDMFRYAVIAPDNGVDSQNELIEFAETVNCNRIFIPGPTIVGSDAMPVDPVLAMAGLSAAIMTETSDPALPMNGVKIKGLGGVSRKVLDAEKKILADNGITTMYTDGSLPAIWRLVTSCVDDKVWQEGTTRFIADYVLETVENTLRANYKRTKNTTRILGDTGIRGTVKSILMNMQDREIIENFDESTLTVIKDPEDMYGALVDYEIDVVTPLYTITITQHLKL